ncbi:MAG: hypothetical protein IPQ11_04010 [Bacteroidetes bacterium]|nr:hypothetical protein [Bacteroidota bacterium]
MHLITHSQEILQAGSAIPTGTYLCKMQTSTGVYLAKLMMQQQFSNL